MPVSYTHLDVYKRQLLHEEVAAFVEGTLSRSAPGQGFSSAVLALLPGAPVAMVGAGMATKGVAMAKSGSAATWLVALAPLVGVFAGMMANWLSVRSAPTARAVSYTHLDVYKRQA